MNKRGLSDVVVSVMIILLVVGAIAVIWGFVRPLLTNAGSQVTTDCFTLSIEPVKCNYGNVGTPPVLTATVLVKRNTGKGNLQGVKLLFNGTSGTNVVDGVGTVASLTELNTIPFTWGITPTTFVPTSVTVAPLIGNGNACNPAPVSVPCVTP